MTPAESEAVIASRVQTALAEAEAHWTSAATRNFNQELNPCLLNNLIARKPSNLYGTKRPTDHLRWSEKERQHANDAMIQTIRENTKVKEKHREDVSVVGISLRFF